MSERGDALLIRLQKCSRLSLPSHARIGCALALSLALMGCSPDPDQLVQRAKQRESSGDLAAAIVDLKSSLQQQPNDGSARYLLGHLYNETFDQVSAENELRRAAELGAVEGGRVTVELGRSLRAQGKYKEILAEIKPSPAYEPLQNGMIHILRGRAHLITGGFDQARQAFVEAKSLAGDHPDVFLFDAQLHAASSDVRGAESLVDQVLQKHPNNFEALAYKGKLLRDQGKNAEAGAVYTKILQINPRHFQALIRHSVISIAQGKLNEAEKDVATLSQYYKGHPQVYVQRGVVQLAAGKPREALESAQLALKSDPPPESANLLAGMAYLSTGSPLQAELALSKYLGKFPTSAIARRGLAEALISRGEGAKALEVLAPLLQSARPDAAAYALAGEAAVNTGNLTQASQWYDKASAIVPADTGVKVRKAMIRIGAGKIDEGLDELSGAVEQTKSATQADELLILTYLQKRRYDEAMAAVEAMEKRVPDSPIGANIRGVVLLAKGSKQAAVQSFERALKLEPTFFPAAANLAQIDLSSGHPDAARKRYDSILKANPTHLAALLASAEMDAVFGNMKSSIELLRRAVKAHPRILDPKVRLATAQVAMQDMQGATQTVEEAMLVHSDEPIALVLAANVFGRAGNINRAIQALTQLTKLVPTPESYMELARAQGFAGRDGDAEATLRKALQAQSNYMPAQIALAGFLAARGRGDAALRFAQDVKASQPKSAIGYLLEGEIHERQKKWKEALEAYRAGMQREESGVVAAAIYRVHVKSGRPREAVAELEQWLQQHPSDVTAQLTAAAGYLDLGDPKTAAVRYERILEDNARNADALNGLALAYYALKDGRALKVAEAAYSLAPFAPHIQDTLGWLLVQNGDAARGTPLLRMAKSNLPDNTEVQLHLAVGLHRSGDKAAARKELEALLATDRQVPQAKEARALLTELK